MITGIVVALPEELATLTSKKMAKGRCVFMTENVIVACSGTGPLNAGAAAELLIAEGATRLISWGCAAALSAALKPGDLILADKLIDSKNSEMVVNAAWLDHAKTCLAHVVAVQTGHLAESVTLVSTGEDKRQLHAHTGAVAVDMESNAVAKAARQNRLPFLAIRAIADPVTMDLPRAIDYSLNGQGDVMMGKLLLFLFLHPAELPGLIKLGMHFNAAKKTLKLVAKRLKTVIDFSYDKKTVMKSL